MADKRFQRIFSEGNGFSGSSEIYVDTQTGVHYLYHSAGYSGGLTVLVDANGKPVTSPVGYNSKDFPRYD